MLNRLPGEWFRTVSLGDLCSFTVRLIHAVDAVGTHERRFTGKTAGHMAAADKIADKPVSMTS